MNENIFFLNITLKVRETSLYPVFESRCIISQRGGNINKVKLRKENAV